MECVSVEINGIILTIYADGSIERNSRELVRWNGFIFQKVFLPNKYLIPVKNGKAGYFQVKIYNLGRSKAMYVHRLVWESFKGVIPEGYEIDHIDEDKSNNSIENLQLMTRKQNMLKMHKSNPHVISGNLKYNKMAL